jgi:cation diffusion facilitator family transporter
MDALQEAGVRLRSASRVTLLGAVINLMLAAVKGVVGLAAGSSVLVADAVHSLSDLGSDIVTLFSLRVASKPPDEDHPYGHGRYETLGALVLAVVLLSAALGIAWDAWSRFGESVEPGVMALWAAALSIAAKEALFHVTVRVGRRHESPLVVANAWHHRSDALSSIAAFGGIAGARMGFPILDPAAAVVVAALIVRMAVGLLGDAIREVTDTALQRDLLRELGSDIRLLPGVVNLHEMRTRRMGPRLLMDLHVEVEGSTTVSDGHQVAERVRQFVFSTHRGVSEVLVHIDPEPDEDLEPGEYLARPRQELESEVRRSAEAVDGVRAVTHVLVHFLKGGPGPPRQRGRCGRPVAAGSAQGDRGRGPRRHPPGARRPRAPGSAADPPQAAPLGRGGRRRYPSRSTLNSQRQQMSSLLLRGGICSASHVMPRFVLLQNSLKARSSTPSGPQSQRMSSSLPFASK